MCVLYYIMSQNLIFTTIIPSTFQCMSSLYTISDREIKLLESDTENGIQENCLIVTLVLPITLAGSGAYDC